MAIKYLPRIAADALINGVAVPTSGLIAGYENASLEPYCQDALGIHSPLIKSYLEASAEGAPTAYDTFLEVANALALKADTSAVNSALGTKLTASQAATVAALGTTVDFVLDAPIPASINATFNNVEVQNALDTKADAIAVSGLMAAVEIRVDNSEAKIDAVIAALKTAGIMA